MLDPVVTTATAILDDVTESDPFRLRIDETGQKRRTLPVMNTDLEDVTGHRERFLDFIEHGEEKGDSEVGPSAVASTDVLDQ